MTFGQYYLPTRSMKNSEVSGKTKDRNPERKNGNPLSFLKEAFKARQVKTDDLSPDDIIIAVMGPTGSGKSTFINIITGSLEIGVGHDLQSCTSEVSNIRLSMPEVAYGDLVFVDTPGFDDTHKSDLDILKMVADWLKTTYERNVKLSGLLYFHRISDNRMAGTPLKNLRMFEELCGKNSFQNVILTTTMWDEVDEETGVAREQELISKYWRAMLDRNSTTNRFLRTRESAFNLIDPLIDKANTRSSLLLQREMVDMREQLPATSAGRELFSKMELLVRQREVLLHRIRNEMKRTEGDKTSLKPLQEEHDKLRISLELAVEEMRKLKLPLGKRFAKMTESFFGGKFTFWLFRSRMSRPSKDQLTCDPALVRHSSRVSTPPIRSSTESNVIIELPSGRSDPSIPIHSTVEPNATIVSGQLPPANQSDHSMPSLSAASNPIIVHGKLRSGQSGPSVPTNHSPAEPSVGELPSRAVHVPNATVSSGDSFEHTNQPEPATFQRSRVQLPVKLSALMTEQQAEMLQDNPIDKPTRFNLARMVSPR